MHKIYLMRHGMTEHADWFCGPDIHLDERGRRQIAAVAQDMLAAGLKIEEIWHSPFARTVESADIAAQILGLKILKPDERLVEWQVGKWFDQSIEAFDAATGYDQNPPPVIHDPEIETLDHMASRVISVLHDARDRAESVLIVSHREPMVGAILKLQGNAYETIHDVSFPRAAVWEVIFDNNGNYLSSTKLFDHSQDH